MFLIRKQIALTILSLLMPVYAMALPVTDGRFDPSEGYSQGYKVSLNVRKTGVIAQQGELWLHQDPVSKDLFIAFTQPLELIDNTYGRNEIGYPKHHNFSDLRYSDAAQFTILDMDGNTMLDVLMDYIHYSGGTYRSSITGGDGSVISGNGAMVTQMGTSLEYNFNTLGFVLTSDSPATDNQYTPNPDYPGWLFEVTYELRIDGTLFANRQFGSVQIPIVHDSPNKLGKNQVYPTDYILFYTDSNQPEQEDGQDIVPEPLSLVLMLSAIAVWCLYCIKKHKLR